MWLIDVLTGANGRTFQQERRKLRKAREAMAQAAAELNGKAAKESPAANLLRRLEGPPQESSTKAAGQAD